MFIKYRTVIITIVLTLSIILTSCLFNREYTEFTIENWNASVYNNRYKMAKDIVENDLLIGKTRNEIISMLGEDGITDFYTSDTRLFYFVGHNYMDSYYLGILFDNKGVVEKAYILSS